MRTTIAPWLCALVLAGFCCAAPAAADDLSDGIEADDNVQGYSEITNASRNFSYLSQRARSKAAAGSGDVVLSDGGALNSVIMESGAKINGDIIIIDDSKGDKTVIAH